MSNGFPGLQWGNFGGNTAPTYAQPYAPPYQPPQARPAVVQQQVQAPEIDFADGLNNPVELALHPNIDLVGMEAAGPYMEPGTVANFRTVITRADRPGWSQEIAGQAAMNPDGQGSRTQCVMGPPGKPVLQLVEQAQTHMLQGTFIQGRITPSRNQNGPNEQIRVTPGQNGALQVRADVDGWQIFEQSQQTQDPQGGWAQVKMHAGQLGGVPFQRVLRPAQDGSTTITGQIGNLTESGKIVTDQGGQTHVSRDIGPYHLEQDIWFVAGQQR